MDQQSMDAKKMFKKLSFFEKIDHIWYYYRRRIILIFLALLLIAYATYDIMSRPQYDLTGTFYSAIYVDDTQIASLEEYLSQFVEDFNGDGKCNIKIIPASVASLGETEGSIAVNNKFSAEMAAGIDPFVIVDNTFYELLQEEVFSMAIEEPRELTNIPEFRERIKLRDDVKVYWVTRSLYSDEKDNQDAIRTHDITLKTEEKIFSLIKNNSNK